MYLYYIGNATFNLLTSPLLCPTSPYLVFFSYKNAYNIVAFRISDTKGGTTASPTVVQATSVHGTSFQQATKQLYRMSRLSISTYMLYLHTSPSGKLLPLHFCVLTGTNSGGVKVLLTGTNSGGVMVVLTGTNSEGVGNGFTNRH